MSLSRLALLVAALSLSMAAHAQSLLEATTLRTEYLENPLGIEVRTPRLTWQLASEAQGVVQTAYQILVASTAEKLAADQGDLWDSGKVASRETALIPYGGAPLTSRAQAHWKVRVWAKDTPEPSAWSAPALWTMGLLAPGDWSADWIGYDAPDPAAPPATDSKVMAGAFWLWGAGDKFNESAPAGLSYFRRHFEVPEGKKIAEAKLYGAADNLAEAVINGKKL